MADNTVVPWFTQRTWPVKARAARALTCVDVDLRFGTGANLQTRAVEAGGGMGGSGAAHNRGELGSRAAPYSFPAHADNDGEVPIWWDHTTSKLYITFDNVFNKLHWFHMTPGDNVGSYSDSYCVHWVFREMNQPSQGVAYGGRGVPWNVINSASDKKNQGGTQLVFTPVEIKSGAKLTTEATFDGFGWWARFIFDNTSQTDM